MIASAVTQPADYSQGVASGRPRTTYVFIFVPVYIGKKSDAKVQSATRGPLAKVRRVFSKQDRHLQPFWTWFIDNPRPQSANENNASICRSKKNPLLSTKQSSHHNSDFRANRA